MHVNEARKQDFPSGVHDFGVGGRINGRAEGLNLAVGDEQIHGVAQIAGVFDKKGGHRRSPLLEVVPDVGTGGEEVKDSHANRNPGGNLIEDQRLGAVRQGVGNVEPAQDGAGVHDVR